MISQNGSICTPKGSDLKHKKYSKNGGESFGKGIEASFVASRFIIYRNYCRTFLVPYRTVQPSQGMEIVLEHSKCSLRGYEMNILKCIMQISYPTRVELYSSECRSTLLAWLTSDNEKTKLCHSQFCTPAAIIMCTGIVPVLNLSYPFY